MYDRITDRARNVMQLADEEARARGHVYISPESLMLGLIKEGSGIGNAILHEVCDKADRLAKAIEQTMGPNTGQQGSPLTKAAIDLAFSERDRLKHNYVGTEHLLLGLLMLPDSPLAGAFKLIDVEPQEIRSRMLALMGDKSGQ